MIYDPRGGLVVELVIPPLPPGQFKHPLPQPLLATFRQEEIYRGVGPSL